MNPTGPAPSGGSQASLEDLIAECIGRCESVGPMAIAEMCTEHPHHAEALRERMRGLSDAGLLDAWDEDLPESLGDFRLLRPLGGGGMGVVYLARQGTLAREVALKLIRPDQLYFPGARERFRREVELVAQLQHPSIVPVFTFGEEKGLPYFAMERVRGCTLGEVLDELQGSDAEELRGSDLARAVGAHLQRTTGEAGVERGAALFRKSWSGACAEIVATLARALEHAHGRGILHRDMKPSNAMLTVDGRVQLFDFGLSTSSDVGKLTRTGSLLGSVPYMAPEQLDAEPLDERTDVYALGVTLYELLTLSQPFAGKGALAMRDAISTGQAEAPRARNTRVPRDLETVCLKAMSAAREERYASAGEFAEDLERFLERKPVRARRAGAALQAWRWGQRHPWQTAVAVLLLLLFVGAPTAIAIQRARSNVRLSAALDQADSERLRAEGNLDRAIEAVQTMLVEVGGDELEGVPGMGPRRARLLQEALALYEGLVDQRADSPNLVRKHGKLLLHAGEVLMLLGRSDEAIERAQSATSAFKRLADDTGDWAVRWDLGTAYGLLARIHNRNWNAEAAERASSAALAALESALLESAGAELERRQSLAATIAMAKRNQAINRTGAERSEERLALAREAVADAEHAVGMRSGDAYAHYALACALGSLASMVDEPAQIVEFTSEAIDEMRRALAVSDRDPTWISSLARIYLSQGRAHAALGDLPATRESFEHGYTLLLGLLEDHPYDEDVNVALMENRYNLAAYLPVEERAQLYAEGLEFIRPLAERQPESFELRKRASVAQGALFGALVESGQLDLAAEQVGATLASIDAFADDFPDNPDRWQTVFPHIRVGTLAHARGETPQLDEIERIVRERAPDQERALRGAGMIFALHCKHLDRTGAPAPERARVADRAMDLLEAAVAAGFDRMHLMPGEEAWSALHKHPRFLALLES